MSKQESHPKTSAGQSIPLPDWTLVGREWELSALGACLRAGRHVLLEGPVGVGKTALARVASESLGMGLLRVDGDGRFTEAKLVGNFDPPQVLKEGYVPEAFRPGPLAIAMERGFILLINEINRMPEGVQNVLLPALDEGFVSVPHYGRIEANRGFGVIATMNPREFVATGHLSEALLDRFELLSLSYQTEGEEEAIVAVNANPRDEISPELIREAVLAARRTRESPRFRRGASVRAAIAITELAHQMGGLDALQDAITLALPTRVELKEDQDPDWRRLAEEIAPSKKSQGGLVRT